MRIVLYFCLFLSLCSFHIKEHETPTVRYLKPIEIKEDASGIDGIDCIYVINLDSRPEKWKRIKQLCDEKGLRVNRVSGVNGWELTDEQLKELCGPYEARMPKGHYGCLLSHLSVLNDAHKRNFERIWILEDDADFLDDIQQLPTLINRLAQIDPKWDLFYTDTDFRKADGTYLKSVAYNPRFDQTLLPKEHYQQREVLDNDLMRIYQRYATTSMIFSKRGIQKVLDYFKHVYVWEAIDGELHWIPHIREYAPRHDIVSNWCTSPHSDTVERPPESHADAFWAAYQSALLIEKMNLSPEFFRNALTKLAQNFPKRAEPLYRLAMHHRLNGNHLLGYLLAKHALNLPRPLNVKWADQWIYDWGIKMELSLCAYYLEKYEECKAISDQMLSDPSLPLHVREQVTQNLQWVFPHLPPQTTQEEELHPFLRIWQRLCNALRSITLPAISWSKGTR